MRAENLDIEAGATPPSIDTTPEELSEYDRKLLSAVVATNKELIIQSKRQVIQLRTVMVHGIQRVTEFITFVTAISGAVFLYGNLPQETKAVIAEKYLNAGITAVVTGVGVKQMVSNRKDRSDLDNFERQQVDEISSIDKSHRD
jgi:hypothetical protein